MGFRMVTCSEPAKRMSLFNVNVNIINELRDDDTTLVLPSLANYSLYKKTKRKDHAV